MYQQDSNPRLSVSIRGCKQQFNDEPEGDRVLKKMPCSRSNCSDCQKEKSHRATEPTEIFAGIGSAALCEVFLTCPANPAFYQHASSWSISRSARQEMGRPKRLPSGLSPFLVVVNFKMVGRAISVVDLRRLIRQHFASDIQDRPVRRGPSLRESRLPIVAPKFRFLSDTIQAC